MGKKLLKLTDSRILFLLIMPAVLYIALSHFRPLMEPDESRYFEISDNMVDTGDYITPRLAQVIYLEKPPLSYWASAVIFKIFGENEFTARLYVGICAWACILLVYFMGSFFHDKRTGLYAAGVLSTSLFFFIFGNFNILDIPLSFFLCLAIWAGYRYIAGACEKRRWLYLLYFSSALAFLTKGLIGVIFPFAILTLWLVMCGQWKRALHLFSPMGIMLFLVIASPWIILVQQTHQDFLWFFFIREHFLRYTTTIHGRYHILLYYFPVVVIGALPWTAFLVRAVWESPREKGPTFADAERSFLWTWIVFVFVFFSLSSSKLAPYIAPMFIPLSVMIGSILRRYDDQAPIHLKRAESLFVHLPVILQSIVFIALLLLPIFLRDNSRLGGDLAIIHSRKWAWLILLPIFCQIMFVFLPDMVKRVWQGGWFLTIYFLSAFFSISMIPSVSAFLTPYKSAYPVAQAVKLLLPTNQDLYQYKMFLYGIATYNELRTPVVEDFGELRYGMKQLPPAERAHYFLSAQQLKERCKRESVLYCITEYEDRLNELKSMFPNLEILWSNGAYYLVKLHC